MKLEKMLDIKILKNYEIQKKSKQFNFKKITINQKFNFKTELLNTSKVTK
jgi:hypothetical protein